MAIWATQTLGDITEIVCEKIGVGDLTIESYISTENMLPDKGGVGIAAKLPAAGKVNAFLPGDILFSNIRTYFKKVWLANMLGGASTDVIVFRPRNNQKVTSQYLYYILSSNSFIEATVTASKGTKMPRGDKDAMRQYVIALPPLPTQQKIASILSAYDDLIENNTRRIKILEEMAQAIYKEWFVNFKFPGHKKVKMVNSKLGKIPEGWEAKTLAETSLNFDRKRRPLSSTERQDRKGPYPYYGAAKVFDYIDDFIFDGEYLLMAEDGSVITPDRKPVLQLTKGKFWANNHTHILQGKPPISSEFLYLRLSNLDVQGYVTGAAQPKITQENMNRIPMLAPSKELLGVFDNIVRPIFVQMKLFEDKNANLRKTRDLLLPKLISGEIEV